MKKLLLSLLSVTLIIGFTACSKPEIEPVDELPVSATLIRSVDYTVRGTRRDTMYTNADKIITEAGYTFNNIQQDKEKNTFYISINAGPHVVNTYGDRVAFIIDKSKLKAGFVGVYSAGAQAANPLNDILYAYSYKTENGISTVLQYMSFGSPWNGEIKIENYDAVRKTISGIYTITSHLDQDPLRLMSRQLEFDAKCKLVVSGTFSNVKIKQD